MYNMISFVVAAPSIAILAASIYYLFKPKPLPRIPHSNALKWFWGDLKGVMEAGGNGTGESQYFSQHATRFGPISQALIGPWISCVIVADPKEVSDILKRRHNDFEHSDRFNVTFAGTMPKAQISQRDGAMWRSHRRLMNPSMSSRYLSLMTPRIRANLQTWISLWEAKYELLQSLGVAAFDATGDAQLFTMDTIGDISFTESFGGLPGTIDVIRSLAWAPLPDQRGVVEFEFPESRQHAAVRLLFKVMGYAVSGPFPKLSYYLNGYWNSEWRASLQYLHGIIDTKIKLQRKTAKERLARGDLSERANSGQETTSGVFSWGLKYLTDHPHVQKRLHEELVQAFDIPEGSARILSYEEVQSGSAPYLDAVVAEILRLAGVAPLLCRKAKRDTHILGYFIPAGTEVTLLGHHVSMHDTMANDSIYRESDHLRCEGEGTKTSIPPWKDDGLAFIPEPWIDEHGRFNSKAGPSYPFGIGQRFCFGSKLATLQLKLGFAALNTAFFLDSLPHPDLSTYEAKEAVTRHPIHAYVNLKKW